MALSLVAGATSAAHAKNGDPVDAEGLVRPPGSCTFDLTTYCDDRFDGAIPSCNQSHVSGNKIIDDGLAMKVCKDGVISRAGLGSEVTVQSTEFGSGFCGQDADGDFCIVCKTFVGAGSGGKKAKAGSGSNQCVKVRNVAMTPQSGTCGAFAVRTDTALCAAELGGLQDSFVDPRLGFLTRTNESVAGQPASTELVLCGGKSWQCINNPAALQPFASTVAAQQPLISGTIHTPGHIKLKSGSWYCY